MSNDQNLAPATPGQGGAGTGTITLICPNLRCRALVQAQEKHRGQRVRCCRCGASFLVPPGKTPANPGQ